MKTPAGQDHSSFGRVINLLSKKDKSRVMLISIFQTLLGALDLLGVIAIGLVVSLSIGKSGLEDQNSNLIQILEMLKLSNLSHSSQVGILTLTAALLLVGKTILSVIFTRKVLFFLSRRGAKISTDLVTRLLNQEFLQLQGKSSHETMFAVTSGVSTVTLNILAPSVILISDLSLLVIMAAGLFFVDPLTTSFTILFFVVVISLLYRFMHVLSGQLGIQSTQLQIESSEKILESLSTFREILVRNRQRYYAQNIGSLRHRLSDTTAEISFLPYVSKYVIETSIVVGALLLGISQFVLQDPSQAATTTAIFLAAGSRIAPSVLRVQQSFTSIRIALAQALPTLDLIEKFEKNQSLLVDALDNTLSSGNFLPEVKFENVSFRYPGSETSAALNISLGVSPGSSLAIAGLSGGGKSTLLDLLLGVLSPDEGQVLISGVPPRLANVNWPGSVGFVPQDIVIIKGTIRENISLGYPIEDATDERVYRALGIANLMTFIENLPNGIDTELTERGANLSGGQRQRIGIARAMFTNPQLLVLDEATSSLDVETEEEVTKSILKLHGDITIVIVAHRFSTIRSCDKIAYLSNGRIIGLGTFDEVRKHVPEFDHQAVTMGL